MCFTDTNKKDIMKRYNVQAKDDILRHAAEEWRKLSDSDRAYWDEEARNDKVRYVPTNATVVCWTYGLILVTGLFKKRLNTRVRGSFPSVERKSPLEHRNGL